MNRKTWIRNVMLTAAGMAFLPSCLHYTDDDMAELQYIAVNDNEQVLLQNITAAIIPATDTLGARDLKLHLFVLKMIDECYEKHDQDAFINGLKNFGAFCSRTTGSAFANLEAREQNSLFKEIAGAKAPKNDVSYFLSVTRYLTVLSFTQSKYVMTELVPYDIAPGYFHGCEEAYKILN